jgi:hypothetical protein
MAMDTNQSGVCFFEELITAYVTIGDVIRILMTATTFHFPSNFTAEHAEGAE